MPSRPRAPLDRPAQRDGALELCPVCQKPSTHVYLEDDAQSGSFEVGSSRRSVLPGTILRCDACGLGFRQSRSSAEVLSQLYRGMDTQVYQSETAGRERTARSHLSIVQRYAREQHSRMRLLDVGCAAGLFLRSAADAGWEVCGVEPSQTLSSLALKTVGARGEVQCATLEQAQLSGSFDAVTLWDVLEHVPDPVSFLRRCRDCVRPGGHIFLNVPDLDSLEARVFGRRWPLLLPEHLNYFSRGSLQQVVERAQLQILRFGRRAAWFSLRYLALRLGQHGVLGSAIVRRFASRMPAGIVFPMMLGELYAVAQRRWERPDA